MRVLRRLRGKAVRWRRPVNRPLRGWVRLGVVEMDLDGVAWSDEKREKWAELREAARQSAPPPPLGAHRWAK